jgi:uncharacterized protein
VRVLSIGTMTLGATIAGSESLDRGVLMWKQRVFDLTIYAQESSTDYMLKQQLGANYVRIDDDASGEQREDIAELDRFSDGAVHVLKERGAHAVQRTLLMPAFAPFRDHIATSPTFFHGPNKNC